MKKRPLRTSLRMNAQRRRRIYTSFADTWERLRLGTMGLGTVHLGSTTAFGEDPARPAVHARPA